MSGKFNYVSLDNRSIEKKPKYTLGQYAFSFSYVVVHTTFVSLLSGAEIKSHSLQIK